MVLMGARCWALGWGEVRCADSLASGVKHVRGLEMTSGSCVCCCRSALDSESASSSIRFSKACLKNVFSVLLIFIYLLLMAVAVFLVYQTIMDFREKLKHPVMSVSYKEVDRYDAPGRACPRTGIRSRAVTSQYPLSHRCIPGIVPGTTGRAGSPSTVWVGTQPEGRVLRREAD